MARVLIVDDSTVARKALTKILVELGHTVVGEAADGEQAFQAYVRHNPDIVTMDLAMEGMSGTEATAKIISFFPEARIIVVSALEEREVVFDALERGARHFLIKPVRRDKVASVITSVLRQRFEQQTYAELVRKLREDYDSICSCNLLKGEKEQLARVLIVDDSSVARKSLREIITSLGHTVVGEAENGSQAFMEYSKHRPDIVTMDLTMQGLGGAEATSKIIATFPEARIIVISAMDDRKVVLDALERGARHFIIKPITQEKFSSVLHNVLQQKYDKQKHMEFVRKLQAAEGSTEKCLPPYEISQENKLTIVRINPNITVTSCQSMCMELAEYLTDSPQVLFDFGTMRSLDETVVAAIEKLAENIMDSGIVKAVSHSSFFVDFITMEVIAPSLASIIRHFPRR